MSISRYDIASDGGLSHFEAYTQCPPQITSALRTSDSRIGELPFGLQDPVAMSNWAKQLFESTNTSLQTLDEAAWFLRQEAYIDNSVEQGNQNRFKRIVREAYYRARPAMPVAFRKYLQRFALRGWDSRPFPAWPVDTTVERIVKTIWERLLRAHGVNELPFIWFWPDGREAALIMTHDVETVVGRDFCSNLMATERQFNVVSAFEVVPEERYPVPAEFLESIRRGGCEVCLHGLNHDGRLFSSEAVFKERAERIRKYAESWGAVGFRSPVMYRNLAWLPELEFSYDMSVPNVGHLDPQPGGCCTVMPYFIGSLVELPLTTIQDYSLFNILQQRSTELWESQIQRIRDENGLISFIIHPDYVNERWSSSVYSALLEILASLRDDSGFWFPLPREVADWWRTRDALRLIRNGADWQIVGTGANRARIAFARLEDGQVRYRVSERP